MKVIHISAANSSTGAGIACVRLHEQLLKSNINSKILFIENSNSEQESYLTYNNSFWGLLQRRFYTLSDNLLKYIYNYDKRKYFSAGYFGINVNRIVAKYKCDIIHLHWINHGFISIESLKSCKTPIIWTMHDCWAFTGGCHHFFNCSGFKQNCGSCEILTSKFHYDLSYWGHNNKNNSYNGDIRFVAISNWMFKQAKSSSLLKNRDVLKIVSGIDTNFFKFSDKKEARIKELINLESKIVLIGAQSLNTLSKGLNFAIQAINEFNTFPLTVLTFGNGKLELINPLHKTINLGYIEDPIRMARVFALSDVFISTPIVESFGMAIAEAQCCGLPVIIFNASGPEEIVEHRTSGYIAEHSSVEGIVDGIDYCFNKEFDRENISKTAIGKYSICVTAEKYIIEYQKMINN